jgi:hypothetical protein
MSWAHARARAAARGESGACVAAPLAQNRYETLPCDDTAETPRNASPVLPARGNRRTRHGQRVHPRQFHATRSGVGTYLEPTPVHPRVAARALCSPALPQPRHVVRTVHAGVVRPVSVSTFALRLRVEREHGEHVLWSHGNHPRSFTCVSAPPSSSEGSAADVLPSAPPHPPHRGLLRGPLMWSRQCSSTLPPRCSRP